MPMLVALALLAVPADNYLSMTNATGSYQVGWAHIHRDRHEVIYEEYTRYTDGVVINTVHHFTYNDGGVLQAADCWSNYPEAHVTGRYESQGLAMDVTVHGKTHVEHIPPFLFVDEMALNVWSITAKEGDTLSYSEIDCLAPNVHRCFASAASIETVYAGTTSQTGRKVSVTCNDSGSRRTLWFDTQGLEVATKEEGIVSLHVD